MIGSPTRDRFAQGTSEPPSSGVPAGEAAIPRSSPVGDPGADEVGDIVLHTVTCLRRAPALFVLLSLVPTLVVVGTLAAVPVLLSQVSLTELSTVSAGLLGAGIVVVSLLLAIVGLRTRAMIAAAADAVAQGRMPTVKDTIERSRGLLARSLGVVLIFAGVAMLIIAIALAAFGQRLVGEDRPPVLVLALIGIVLLLVWTLVSARLYPLLPVFALEHDRRGLAALGRAWRLTGGQYRRTLSCLLVLGSLTLLAATVAALPLALPTASGGDLPTGLIFGRLLPWTVLTVLLCGSVGIVSTAFLTVAQTLFHRDLAARQPAVPTLNWAPPTTAPAGGIAVQGWRPTALSQGPAQPPPAWPAPDQQHRPPAQPPSQWPAAPQQWPAPDQRWPGSQQR